ncbi:MAG TPA: 30S ribosome-binding factor RbfA [Stellaceae bacterium]|jgi:ribosome-binding factor A|nr:30S ribosome-binding factor RbfA [Stellaceae bacterium]
MPKRGPSAPGPRPLRVGEELRHALAHIFEQGRLHDPALAGLALTVTEVRVSPDLKNATAYVMPLAGAHAGEALEALKRASGFLRRELAQAVKLRIVPTIGFALDTSFEHASRIDALLHRPEVARDLEPHPGEKKQTGKKQE